MTSATDFDRLSAALITLDELVRRYRYESRSNALWLEIIDVVKVVGDCFISSTMNKFFC